MAHDTTIRGDLLDAQAAVDWTKTQLPTFREKIDAWCTNNLDVIIVETPSPASHDAIVARPKEPIPLSLNVEAGVYINVLRSALDILATSLGRRHMVLYPDDVYFPAADSAEQFALGDYKGSKFVSGLGADDGLILKALNPYKGGHGAIWPLHQLDIKRKHKRLLAVSIRPMRLQVSWVGQPGEPVAFAPINNADGFLRDNYETVLGLFAKGAADRNVQATMEITFDEPYASDTPIVPTLERYASQVADIIKRFDQ